MEATLSLFVGVLAIPLVGFASRALCFAGFYKVHDLLPGTAIGRGRLRRYPGRLPFNGLADDLSFADTSGPGQASE
jgi:hypothetical protein